MSAKILLENKLKQRNPGVWRISMNKRDEHMGVDGGDMFLCNGVCNVVGRFTVISLFYLTVL